MKRMGAFLLAVLFLLVPGGCGGGRTPGESSAVIPMGDTGSTADGSTTAIAPMATTSASTKSNATGETTQSSTQTTGRATTRRSTDRGCGGIPTKPTVAPSQTAVKTLRVSPLVIRQPKEYRSRYYKVISTDDGRIVAVGDVEVDERSIESVIDVYDEDMVLQNTHREGLMGYYDIIACRDGGFLAFQACGCEFLQKLSADLVQEWKLYLVSPGENMWVTSMVQLSDGGYAVLYKTYDSSLQERGWYLAMLSEEGQILEQQELNIRCYDCEDPGLVADDNGGFYLFIGLDPIKDMAAPYELRIVCDRQKGREVVVAQYAPNRTNNVFWYICSAWTVGGTGDDWCEEATVDEAGNFYLALGNCGLDDDPFWDEVLPGGCHRRMLVKLSPEGEVAYRTPLSARSLAVDQVFGIHVRQGQVYVSGMSAYYDGVLAESRDDSDDYCLFTAYAAYINADGTVASRCAFRYDHIELGEPGGSAWLPDGRLVLCGAVSAMNSDFSLSFDEKYAESNHRERALFVYELP